MPPKRNTVPDRQQGEPGPHWSRTSLKSGHRLGRWISRIMGSCFSQNTLSRPSIPYFSSVSYTHLDVYKRQPLERELNVTRRCLEAIERQGFGVAVLTKSNLLLRDLELLRRIHRKARVVVCTTFTTLDENLCRLIEPNVCTTRQRFEMLRACREAGLLTGVWLCPCLLYTSRCV